MKNNSLKLGYLLLGLAVTAFSYAGDSWPPKSWTTAVKPFHITGSIYYVGSEDLTSYLIVGNQGHILINVGLTENADLVIKSIAQLGFKIEDIKYILVTQAHFDHAGGVHQLVEKSHAQVLVGQADYEALVTGGLNDYAFGNQLTFSAIKAESLTAVINQEKLKLGDLLLTAIATPGHTPGSTSWILDMESSNGQPMSALFQSSISIPSQAQIHENPVYPELIEDYQKTLQLLGEIQADYVLADHVVHIKPNNTNLKGVKLNKQWFEGDWSLKHQLLNAQKSLNKRVQAAQ